MPLQTPLIPHCQSHLNQKLHITENLTKLKMKDNTFKSFTGYPLQDHAKYLHSPVEAPGLSLQYHQVEQPALVAMGDHHQVECLSSILHPQYQLGFPGLVLPYPICTCNINQTTNSNVKSKKLNSIENK